MTEHFMDVLNLLLLLPTITIIISPIFSNNDSLHGLKILNERVLGSNLQTMSIVISLEVLDLLTMTFPISAAGLLGPELVFPRSTDLWRKKGTVLLCNILA